MEIVHTASFRDKNLLGVDQNISHQRGPFSSQHRHRTERIFLKRAKMAFKPEHGAHQRSDTGRSFHFHADFLKKKNPGRQRRDAQSLPTSVRARSAPLRFS